VATGNYADTRNAAAEILIFQALKLARLVSEENSTYNLFCYQISYSFVLEIIFNFHLFIQVSKVANEYIFIIET